MRAFPLTFFFSIFFSLGIEGTTPFFFWKGRYSLLLLCFWRRLFSVATTNAHVTPLAVDGREPAQGS